MYGLVVVRWVGGGGGGFELEVAGLATQRTGWSTHPPPPKEKHRIAPAQRPSLRLGCGG